MFAGKEEFSDLLAAFLVFSAVSPNLSLGGLLCADNRMEPVVGVLHSMHGFLRRSLITPDLLLRIGEAIPAVRDDACDVSVVTLNICTDLLCSSESRTEEHESIPWTRNMVRIFATRIATRKWYGHARKSG